MEGTSFSIDVIDNLTDYRYQYEDTENTEDFDSSYWLIPIRISFFVTFILGTIGNGLVIWIAGFKMKKTVTVIWFLNLAVADFALNVTFPLQMFLGMIKGWSLFIVIICKTINTVLYLNMSVSTSFLMIISVDRCTSVLCPVWSQNHRTLKLSSVISAVIWVSCFLLNSPYFAFMDIIYDPVDNISYCIAVYSEDPDTEQMRITAMLITRFGFMFLIPFSIIIVCYSLVTFRLRRSRSVSGSSQPFKIIITVVICFFCFWFPFHLLSFLNMNTEINETVMAIMYNVVICLCFFNSCVNPIIYVFVGRDFKMSLFKSIPFLLESTFRERYYADT